MAKVLDHPDLLKHLAQALLAIGREDSRHRTTLLDNELLRTVLDGLIPLLPSQFQEKAQSLAQDSMLAPLLAAWLAPLSGCGICQPARSAVEPLVLAVHQQLIALRLKLQSAGTLALRTWGTTELTPQGRSYDWSQHVGHVGQADRTLGEQAKLLGLDWLDGMRFDLFQGNSDNFGKSCVVMVAIANAVLRQGLPRSSGAAAGGTQ